MSSHYLHSHWKINKFHFLCGRCKINLLPWVLLTRLGGPGKDIKVIALHSLSLLLAVIIDCWCAFCCCFLIILRFHCCSKFQDWDYPVWCCYKFIWKKYTIYLRTITCGALELANFLVTLWITVCSLWLSEKLWGRPVLDWARSNEFIAIITEPKFVWEKGKEETQEIKENKHSELICWGQVSDLKTFQMFPYS